MFKYSQRTSYTKLQVIFNTSKIQWVWNHANYRLKIVMIFVYKEISNFDPRCEYHPIYNMLVCSIFILLSRESEGGAIFWTNPHRLRSCPFPSLLECRPLAYEERALIVRPLNSYRSNFLVQSNLSHIVGRVNTFPHLYLQQYKFLDFVTPFSFPF